MTDYMKEAERMLDEFYLHVSATVSSALADEWSEVEAAQKRSVQARTALLAHIQRGGVLDKPARVGNGIFGAGLPTRYVIETAQRLYEAEAERGPRTLEQIHEDERVRRKTWEMFNGPLTGSEDIQRGVPEGYVAVPRFLAENHRNLTDVPRYQRILDDCLAAAPDHFRDAAEMVAEPADDRIAAALHYPGCWDTAAYPTVESAPAEVCAHYRCTEHDAPAGVPMPEPDSECTHADDHLYPVWREEQMRTYGDAREAAGYARGRKEAGRDAERRGQFLVECNDVALRIDPFGYGIYDAIDNDGQPYQSQALADEIAALRGEVKP